MTKLTQKCSNILGNTFFMLLLNTLLLFLRNWDDCPRVFVCFSIYHGPDRRLHSKFGCTSRNYSVVYYYILTSQFHLTYMLSFPIAFPLSALFTSPSSSMPPSSPSTTHLSTSFSYLFFVFLLHLPPTHNSVCLSCPPTLPLSRHMHISPGTTGNTTWSCQSCCIASDSHFPPGWERSYRRSAAVNSVTLTSPAHTVDACNGTDIVYSTISWQETRLIRPASLPMWKSYFRLISICLKFDLSQHLVNLVQQRLTYFNLSPQYVKTAIHIYIVLTIGNKRKHALTKLFRPDCRDLWSIFAYKIYKDFIILI